MEDSVNMRKKSLCVLLVFAVLFCFAGCDVSTSSEPETSLVTTPSKSENDFSMSNNAYSNNLNAGIAVSDGEYLYYIGLGDSSGDYIGSSFDSEANLTVKRVRLDNLQGDGEVVVESGACNMFLSNTGMLYFASDEGITSANVDNHISEVLLEYYDSEECGIMLQNEWIYSSYGFDGAGDDNFNGISRVNISTKTIEQVFNGENIGIDSYTFCIIGDIIYFRGSNADTEGIFTVSVNGGNPKLFYEGNISCFTATDDYIIISDFDESILVIPLNGNVPFSVGNVDSKLSSINAFKENVFYVCDGNLFRTHISDGTQEEIINAREWGGKINYINIAGGKLVFLFQTTNGGNYESGIYCADLDGNNAFCLK